MIATAARHYEAMGALIECGASLDASMHHGSTALMLAAELNDVKAMELLLDAGAHIHAKGGTGKNAFHVAVECGSRDALRFLIARGALTKEPELIRRTALIAAAAAGAGVQFKATPLIESKDHYGHTALMSAAATGDTELIALLLECGADPNSRDSCRLTPLHHAARNQGTAEGALTLLRAGADVNAQTPLGLTPLLDAVTKGNLPLVKVFAENGAHVDGADELGRTALILAARMGRADLIDVLLRAGANPYLRDSLGLCAADRAITARGDDPFSEASRLLEPFVSQRLAEASMLPERDT
jgi:ankyrin repeat protein